MTDTSTFHKVKQLIVVNESLKMSKQKRVFYVSRASIDAFSAARSDVKKTWLYESRPKLVVDAFDEKDLQDLFSKAQRRKLPVALVMDVGQFASGGIACLGVGPASNAEMDELLGVLNFYRWIHENAVYAKRLG